MQQLSIRTTLQGGKYIIIRVLGQGGFGITYLAENLLLDKKVAIKEFFPKEYCDRDSTSRLTLGTQNNAETVAKLKDRFLKEARNIAKLDHPGIVKVHDVFEENNTAYYVMDYIEGENLNEMVKRIGPLSESKAIEYIRKVGDALDYIHSRNMIHFDVKPANIVVRRDDDQPILIDFGLSKQYDVHGEATSTLMQGVSQGYSPIELYTPGTISTFSPQTDIYSLGATLVYLLIGKIPTPATQIFEQGLQFPACITGCVRTTIRRAMNVNKAKRYESVNMFVEAMSTRSDQITQTILSDSDATRTIILTPNYDGGTTPKIANGQKSIDKSNPTRRDYKAEAYEISSNLAVGGKNNIILIILCPVVIFLPIFLLFCNYAPKSLTQNQAIIIHGVMPVLFLCGILWFVVKIFRIVHKKRIEQWKREHPKDLRSEYLEDFIS